MNADDTLAIVVSLASEVEDRTPTEQRALIDVALGVDVRRGKFATSNPHPVRPFLTRLVLEGQEVGLTAAQVKRHGALLARWVVCESDGLPAGMHTLGMSCRPEATGGS